MYILLEFSKELDFVCPVTVDFSVEFDEEDVILLKKFESIETAQQWVDTRGLSNFLYKIVELKGFIRNDNV